MRILFVHNYYQRPGGEDVVVRNEMEVMAENGHQVWLLSETNTEISDFSSKLEIALSLAWNKKFELKAKEVIREFQPDIVHVHNIFPMISPSVYDAAIEFNVPVIQTLHNYRVLCASATLLRKNRICEKCVHGTVFNAILHKCYRGSRLGTTAVAFMIGIHRKRDTWNQKIDRVIVLTRFAKSKLSHLFEQSKIAVKPNFLRDPGKKVRDEKSNHLLFVGRLSEEKGVNLLVSLWRRYPNTLPELRIVGDGPMLEELSKENLIGVKLHGYQEKEEIYEQMMEAKGLLFPSIWYEGFPMVILEAYALGLPVLGSNLGSMMNVIEHGKTGLLFDYADVDRAAESILNYMKDEERRKEMSNICRQHYEDNYTPEKNYEYLLKIYEEAIANATMKL
ncbi:MAG: glycosyltransferase [Gammaproteobacteria bacterium]|nr:glycosyltransferase [Gammaproteobacteria bacterium]